MRSSTRISSKPSPYISRRVFRTAPSSPAVWLWRALMVLGCAIVFLSLAPVGVWWSARLATPWESLGTDGGTLVTLSGPGVGGRPLLGDSSYWRAIYTLRAWRAGRFQRVVVSGAPSAAEMATFLEAGGIPKTSIVVEGQSQNVHDSALALQRLSTSLPAPLSLVTSDFQTYRAIRTLRKAGLKPRSLPHPDGIKRGQLQSWPQRLSVIADLIAESIAIAEYRYRGWM